MRATSWIVTPLLGVSVSWSLAACGSAERPQVQEAQLDRLETEPVAKDAETTSQDEEAGDPVLQYSAKSQEGNTPLHDAALDGQTGAVELLIAKGADFDAENNSGDTSLHMAAFNGHMAAAQLLIAKGANVNSQNHIGVTPLHYAALNGRTAVAELLIAKGGSLEARNKDGLAPLHLAASAGRVAVAELLVAKGAKVEAEIKARAFVLHGELKGTVRAGERAVISETAEMNGDVITPKITIASGARFSGGIRMKEKE